MSLDGLRPGEPLRLAGYRPVMDHR